MDRSRRRFLAISGLVALDIPLEMCGSGMLTGLPKLFDYFHRLITYKSPQEIAEIFREAGIEPNVKDNGGNRTLLEIGEWHMGYGDHYVDFFNKLKRRVGIDKIFMEGVYADYVYPDPYTARIIDIANWENMPLFNSLEEKRKNDNQGYFGLSKSFSVFGLEDRDLEHDIIKLELLVNKIGLLYLDGEKDKRIEEEINSLARRLRTTSFPVRSYPEKISPEEKESLDNEAYDAACRVVYTKRNHQFVNVIDNMLRPYEVGALIVGINHIEQEDHLIKYGTIQTELAERRINTVFITPEDIIDKYNKLIK